MLRRHVAALALAGGVSAGCAGRCGTYEHQTGLEWDLFGDEEPPEPIDAYTLHEICGAKMGSIGYRDLFGDGIALISFDGTHPDGHVAIALTSGIFRDVYFQLGELEVGNMLTIDDLTGQSEVFDSGAYVLSNGSSLSGAALTAGEIEILDSKYNEFWAADAFRMRFDLTFGEPGVSEHWYTAVGEDWIAMQ